MGSSPYDIYDSETDAERAARRSIDNASRTVQGSEFDALKARVEALEAQVRELTGRRGR